MNDERIREFSFGDAETVVSGTYTTAELRNEKVFPTEKIRDDICQVKKSMEDSVPLLKDGVEISKEMLELQRELLACGQANSADMKKFMDHNLKMTERIEASNKALCDAITQLAERR